jgi:3-methyladenine DNA glycosylase AlkD
VRTEQALADALRAALAAQADPVRAEGQQRYMKSAMPYYGVTTPAVRAVVRDAVAVHPLVTRPQWLRAVRLIWDGAVRREERYAAIGVLQHRRYRAWVCGAADDLLALLRHVITTGAWWDLVDDLAAHAVGGLLAADPTTMKPVLRDWARDDDLWLRRTAILSQLLARDRTDADLLHFAIEGSVDDRDSFARKAIGWALREYSKTDADWVRRYVRTHEQSLSPLSRREALKWLERQVAEVGDGS